MNTNRNGKTNTSGQARPPFQRALEGILERIREGIEELANNGLQPVPQRVPVPVPAPRRRR